MCIYLSLSIYIYIYNYNYYYCKFIWYITKACFERWGESTVNWDTVGSNCSIDNCLSNFGAMISSKSSNWEKWARWGFPTVSCALPKYHTLWYHAVTVTTTVLEVPCHGHGHDLYEECNITAATSNIITTMAITITNYYYWVAEPSAACLYVVYEECTRLARDKAGSK